MILDKNFMSNSKLEIQGYFVVKNVISKDVAKFIHDYIKITEKILRYRSDLNDTDLYMGDAQVEKSIAVPSSLAVEVLAESLVKKLSVVTDIELVPTYTYSRVYKKGASLKIHTDRDACEYSISINLHKTHDWPLCFKNKKTNEINCVELDVGDGVIYKGREIEHWRDEIDEEKFEMTQCFLHYVNGQGKFKDLIYDHREFMGLSFWNKHWGDAIKISASE